MKMPRWLGALWVIALLAAGASPVQGARALEPPGPGAPYVRSGIPVPSADFHPTLNHLNLALPAHDVDEAGRSMASILAASPVAAPAAVPEEIDLLSQGLDDDPKLIFDYVHNNYDFIPSWGLLRGPVELVQAKAGNPFDQAYLLASLLTAAGYETHFVFGTIRMPVAQGLNWSGIVNESALWSAFASGGIGSQVAGGNLRLNHVWVKVKVGDAWYPLDPSFKSYQPVTGLSLPAAMGYSRDDLVNAAQSGATITANYAQKINSPQLEGKLQGYALALLNAMGAADPAMRLDQATGGRSIVPQTTATLPAALPYMVESVAGETAGMPDNWVFKLRVQAPGVDQVIPYYTVANQRLTYFYVPATAADAQKIQQAGGIYNVYPAYGVNMKPELRLGGALLATGSSLALGWYQQVNFTLQTAWKDSNGNRIDIGFSRNFFSSNWYALALRNGDMSDAALDRCNQGLGEQVMTGAEGSEPVLGQGLHCLGMAMHSEYGHLRRLAGQLAGVIDALNTGAMVVGQTSLVEYEPGGQQRPLRVKVGSYYVDAQLNLGGVVSVHADANRERGYHSAIAWAYSATEGNIMTQLQDNPGLSTVRVIDVANRQGQKLYHLTKSNVAGILATLQYPSYIENSLNADVQNGYEVTVPEKNVTVNQWTGTGWYSYDPQSGSMGTWLNGSVGTAPPEGAPQVGAPQQSISGGSGSNKGTLGINTLLTKAELSNEEVGQYIDHYMDQYDRNRPVQRQMQEYIDQELNPYTADPFTGDPGKPKEWLQKREWELKREFVEMDRRRELAAELERRDRLAQWEAHEKYGTPPPVYANLDPVQVVTGAYVHTDTDLEYGSLGPWTVFERQYAADRNTAADVLGRGWRHSYMVRLDRSSVWPRTYGDEAGREAARAIAGIYAALDVPTTAAGALPFANLVTGSEAADWAGTQSVGNAWTVTQGDGSHVRFVPLADGSLVPLASGWAGLAVDGQGAGTLTYKGGMQLRFDALGKLVQIVDANGNAAALAYDGQGRVSKVTDAAGRVLAFTYSGSRLSQLTDPAGRVFRFEYDSRGDLVRYVDGAGRAERYEYDGAGRMVSYFDAADVRVITNTYDLLGRVARQTNCLGGLATLRYGDGRNTLTDHMGRPTVYEYNRRGWLIRSTNAAGGEMRWDWDALRRQVEVTNLSGTQWALTYDAHDNPLRVTDGAGRTVAFTYDAGNNLLTARGVLGGTTRYVVDGRGNPTQATDVLGGVTHYAYNAAGLMTEATDALGRKTGYQYDPQGNLVRVTGALGGSWSGAYDALGRVVKASNPLGSQIMLAYDLAGNLKEATDPLGNKTTYTYDGRNQPTSVTDPLGRATRYEYGALGGPVKVTDAAGKVTRYTYDSSALLTAVQDAGGRTTRYEYDPAGRLASVTDPLGGKTQYVRNAAGDPTEVRRADGSTVRYTYSAAGWLAGVTYADGVQVNYTNDPLGRLLEAREAVRSTRYTRDLLGRVTAVHNVAPDYDLAYSYDAVGNRTDLWMTVGGATVVELGSIYDALNRMTQLSDVGRGHTVRYTYDAAGNPTAVDSFNGARTTYAYDALDRPLHVTATGAEARPLFDRTYAYGPGGNLVALTATGPGAVSETYGYNAIDELAEVKAGQAVVSYAYGPTGSLVQMTTAVGASGYSYDAAGRLTKAGSATFTYDPLGRRTTQTDAGRTVSYLYGRDNRLTGINLPLGEQWRFGYDHAGRRISEQGPGGTRRFAYDGWDVIAEQDASGEWSVVYAYGPTGLVMRHASPGTGAQGTAYHDDGIGNILALTGGADGSRREAYRADPFGVAGRSAGLDANPYRFAGADGVRGETPLGGLYLMGNRVYDAATGQFLTRDPLGGLRLDPLGGNPYIYARGNPLRHRDPLGLQDARFTTEPDGSITIQAPGGSRVTLPPGASDWSNSLIDAIGSSG